MTYRQFAYVYDQLMQDAPYDRWLDVVKRHKEVTQPEMESIIDLGCGTGNITIPLAKQGYHVTGIDLSEDMLALALDKSLQEHVHIQWLHQDMRDLEVPEKVDTIICFCDSLNYITDDQDVRSVFSAVSAALKPGGYFLFDVHTLYKMRVKFGNRTFASNDEEISLIWQCFWQEDDYTVEHQLTFFQQNPDADGLYERFDEIHLQKGYELSELSTWLTEAGFKQISVTADFDPCPPKADSERLFVVAQKYNL